MRALRLHRSNSSKSDAAGRDFLINNCNFNLAEIGKILSQGRHLSSVTDHSIHGFRFEAGNTGHTVDADNLEGLGRPDHILIRWNLIDGRVC